MFALSAVVEKYGTVEMNTSKVTLNEWRWLFKELNQTESRCRYLTLVRPDDRNHKANFAIPIEQRPEAYLFAGLKGNVTVRSLTLTYNVLDTNMIYLLSNALMNNYTIQSLYLSNNTDIDFEGAIQLARCLPKTALEYLDLAHTSIGNKGCEALLSSLPKTLTDLILSYCGITGESLPCLTKFIQSNQTLLRLDLTSLRLHDGVGWRDTLRKVAGDCQSRCELKLYQPLREQLDKSSNTDELYLYSFQIRDEDVRDICVELSKKPTKWTSLTIWINQLSVIGIHYLIDGLPNFGLIKLHVRCEDTPAKLLATFFQVLGTCENLTILNLKLSYFNGIAADHLASALKTNQSLTTLDLDSNRNITHDGLLLILKALKTNNKITELILSQNGIGKKCLLHLVEGDLGGVTKLDLKRNGLCQDGMRLLSQALEKNNTVKELDLTRNDIGHEGTQYLALALEKNVTLTKLILDDNRFGPKSAFELAKAIEKNNMLQEISLRENGSGAEGAEYLARALKKNTSVIKLDLYRNNIGDSGASHMAHASTTNRTLEELDLSTNHISNEGAVALGEALVTNRSVRKLNLQDNAIGDEGSRALALSIEVNDTLSDINLFQNNIGDEGYNFIISALKKNHTLVKLHLGGYGGRISDDIGILLAYALANIHTLRELILYYNNIGDRTLACLFESFPPNLTTLDLHGNCITARSESIILAFLKTNHTLKILNLSDNPIETGDETNAKNNEIWQRVLNAMKENDVSDS